LRRIVDAYTGELAETVGWPWLAPYRETIRRNIIDAYTDLGAGITDPHAALALLQDALRVDPYNEDLHRQAMRRSAAAGDPAAARRLRHSLTERLASLDPHPHPDPRQIR